jgi:hypothetical protein
LISPFVAIVYARVTGLNKKKFRMIDLWECRVSDETSSMPEIINAVAGPSSTSQK